MPRISTASTGPMEHRATIPKLFSLLRRSPKTWDTPTPRAMRKGTVMGPVVTPPESKATGSMESFPPTASSRDRAKSSI